jgi:hypothetical protein
VEVGDIVLEAAARTSGGSGDNVDAVLDQLQRALDDAPNWRVVLFEKHRPNRGQAQATLRVYRQEPHDYRYVLGATTNVTADGRAGDGGQRGFGRRGFGPPGGGGRGGGRGGDRFGQVGESRPNGSGGQP